MPVFAPNRPSTVSLRSMLCTACASLLMLALIVPAPAAAATLEAALRTAMDDSAAGWSTGDLDRFMAVYEPSPDTVYVGAKGLVQGEAAIRAMYAPRFAEGTAAAHGKLTFDLLQTRPLGPDHALLIGRYHLAGAGANGAEATGLFSLTFHRQDGRWRIVCDHTS